MGEKTLKRIEVIKFIAEKIARNEDINIQELAKICNRKANYIENCLDELRESYRIFKDNDPMLLIFDKAEALYRLRQQDKRKKVIAEYIVTNILEEQDTLILDSGTTIYKITEEMIRKELKVRGVLTNNLLILFNLQYMHFHNKLDAISLTGGQFERKPAALQGKQVVEAIKEYGATKSIIGISGMDKQGALYCFYPVHEQSKSEILKKAENECQIIIPCDLSKVGKAAGINFASLSDIEEGHFKVVIDTISPDKKSIIDDLMKKFGQSHFHIVS